MYHARRYVVPRKAVSCFKPFFVSVFFFTTYTPIIGLSLIKRPILISRINLKLIQIDRKAPLLFCLLVILSSRHVMWHNFAKLYFMHHLGPGRKAPQWPNREKFWDCIYPFHAISSNFGSAGRKGPPPPPSSQTGKNSETWSIYFMQFPATLVQLAESSHPVAKRKNSETASIHFMQFPATLGSAGRKAIFSAFLWETWLMSHMSNTHGPHTTNPHSESSYPNIFFRLPTYYHYTYHYNFTLYGT